MAASSRVEVPVTTVTPRTVLVAAVLAALLLVPAFPSRSGSAATFVVNSRGDGADANLSDSPNLCDTNLTTPGPQCTLRAAIQESNDTPGVDTINFTIGGPQAVKTIAPGSDLPTITDGVFIDGYSQPGASPNTRAKGNNAVLRIQLDGSNATVGLTINTSNTTVQGLVINRFAGGISINGGPNITVRGCFVGTNAAGTKALGNLGEGIGSFANDVTIGGAAPAARNLLSGNGEVGFETSGQGNEVLGNYIGTDRTGTKDLGNTFDGVALYSSNNFVGGPGSSGNVIGFNGSSGVRVVNFANVQNSILRNSIFDNDGLGIDLMGDGRTPNDPPPDADAGANQRQNWPVIESATRGPQVTRIKGMLESAFEQAYTLRFFSSPPGSPAEGKTFLGAMSVTTDPAGSASFTFIPDDQVAVGRRITATATDPNGNTSEFSIAKAVRPIS
jgi:CSLREA domain-containing protein